MIDRIGRTTEQQKKKKKKAASAASSAAAHDADKQVDRGDFASSEEMIARFLTNAADETERREVLARAKKDSDFRNRLSEAAVARIALIAAHADRSGCPTSEELVDYADGQLNDKHSRELAEHERRCVVCRKELRALRRMDEAFQQENKHENTAGASPENDEPGGMELPDSKGDPLYHKRNKGMNYIFYKANTTAAFEEETIAITEQCMAVVRPAFKNMKDPNHEFYNTGNPGIKPGDKLVLTYAIKKGNGQVRILGFGEVGKGDGTCKKEDGTCDLAAFVTLPEEHDDALEKAGYQRDPILKKFTGICLKSFASFDSKDRREIKWPGKSSQNAICKCTPDEAKRYL
jgi:hypothetical protein